MKSIRETIIETIHEVVAEQECGLVEPLNDNTVLLESGLDSLGFAILVSELEANLSYDPFAEMEAPVYPRTLAEFVSVYEKFSHLRTT